MDKELVLPPGDYYLGDPCYVIDEDWDGFLQEFWALNDRGGVFKYKGKTCAAFYTRYGDGQYEVVDGAYGWLPVDAGMIGMIPMSLAGWKAEGAGVTTSITKPAKCWENEGWLHFGDIVVNTSDEEEENES